MQPLYLKYPVGGLLAWWKTLTDTAQTRASLSSDTVDLLLDGRLRMRFLCGIIEDTLSFSVPG